MDKPRSRRDFLKVLSGIGLGAVAAELYERLYEIPSMEKSYEEKLDSIKKELGLKEEELKGVKRCFPLIKSFYWSPSKVVNDKIYDLKVNLEIFNPLKSLKEAELKLIPIEYDYFITNYGMRKEDYPLVFPPEETRSIKLNPKGLEEEIFEVDFKDLKGGREYLIKAEAKDLDGNVNSEEIKTPYIREFENIAPLEDITVAAFYYNWYSPTYYIPKNLPDKPLLGFYNSDDNIVFNKHVDWATGHGIDVFVFPWFFEGHEQEEILKKNMKADLFNQIKFSFIGTYVDRFGEPPYDFDREEVRKEFVDNILYATKTYLSLPNSWRIDSRLMIVIWGSSDRYTFSQGVIKKTFERLRERVIRENGNDLFIISDDIEIFHPLETLDSSDALYHYDPFYNDKTTRDMTITEDVLYIINWMQKLAQLAREHQKPFIPTIAPGSDNTYDYRTTMKAPIIYRDVSGFKMYIEKIKKFPNPLKTTFLTSYNEWFEQTQIEPTHGYGLEYLKSLKCITNYE